MENFPPNSKSSRRVPDEPKKIERVTSADATRRPKTLGRRLKETFIGDDPRATFDYVIVDVIIPGARDMLFDAVEAGFQRLIYGEGPRRPRPGRAVGPYADRAPHIDYSGMSRGPVRQPQQQRSSILSRGSRARGSFDELVIQSRPEAEEVIDRMFDILSQYGQVSVAHLYELTGVQGSHTDIKWGWTQLRGAKPRPLRQGGYILDLPEPEPFD
jgi:hypothetical protein